MRAHDMDKLETSAASASNEMHNAVCGVINAKVSGCSGAKSYAQAPSTNRPTHNAAPASSRDTRIVAVGSDTGFMNVDEYCRRVQYVAVG
jgi:hypothetical protein